MKAVVLPSFGQAERLELRDVAEPTPGPGEIKVRVVAAGINPVDWKLRSGAVQKWMPLELPALLGMKPVRSELVYTLVRLDKEYTAAQPSERWENVYARELLAIFNGSATP